MKAIILKKTQFAETNEVVAFYSREKGKIRGMAKATKSAKSKLAFGLQPLFLTELEVTEGRSSMPTIIGVKVLNSHAGLRTSVDKIASALSAAELILKTTADEQPNEQLFDLFSDFLSYMSSEDFDSKEIKSVWRFMFDALSLVGFKARLDKCVLCEKKILADERLSFSSRLGGLVCADCFGKTAADILPISEDSRAALDLALPSNSSVFKCVDNSAAPTKELHLLAENFASYILERDLKAPKFLV